MSLSQTGLDKNSADRMVVWIEQRASDKEGIVPELVAFAVHIGRKSGIGPLFRKLDPEVTVRVYGGGDNLPLQAQRRQGGLAIIVHTKLQTGRSSLAENISQAG